MMRDYGAALSMRPRAMAQAIPAMGINGDTEAAHLTPGEVVIPREVMTPELFSALLSGFDRAGIDPAQFMAGSPTAQVNPTTGLPMFAVGGLRDYEQEGGFQGGMSVSRDDVINNTGQSLPAGWDTIPTPAHRPTVDGAGRPVGSASTIGMSGGGGMDDGAIHSDLAAFAPGPQNLFGGEPQGPTGFPLPPERPEVRQRVDEHYDNWWDALDPLDYSVQFDPATQENRVAQRLDVDPLFMGAGLITGIPGLGWGAEALGLKDPLGFSIPLGFEGDTQPSDLLDANQARAEGQQDAAISQGLQAPAAPAPAAQAPAVGPPPNFLGLDPQMSALQLRSAIATRGTQGDDSRYRDAEAIEYFASLLAAALIKPDGTLNDLDVLLPVEMQFLRQVMGIEPTDAKGLLQEIGKSTGKSFWQETR